MGIALGQPGLVLEGRLKSVGVRGRMEAVGPKSEAQLLEEGCLPPGGIRRLWLRVADPGGVCSRSLNHVTLHFRSNEKQKSGRYG